DGITDSAGIDAVRSSISYTLGATLENLALIGSDAINGTGNLQANRLNGTLNSAANVLSGLAGNDTYIVGAGDTVIEGLNAGIDLVLANVSFSLGDNIENLTLLGTDAINASGNALANILLGNDGANVLDGKAGSDTLQGGKGNDTYIVDLTASNTLQDGISELANEGNDSLVLRGGNAALALSTLTLAETLENLDASATGLTKFNLVGNASNNVLTGNDADNRLGGGAGADTLIGGLGNDTYGVDNAGDTIIESADAGTDSVNIQIAIAGGSYTLGNNLENATLFNTVAFNLNGNALNNVLTGNDLNNVIDGSLGADSMNGGAGDDLYFVDNL
ncbi:MAG: calcium-binding protein, partial [Lacisediminimonas sp.]|nr:calcium-binding protein [Lacisediminimonas sp.]